MECWNTGIMGETIVPTFHHSHFRIWRQLWHTRKLEEVLGTAEIVPDSDWASNDLAGNGSRRETSWCVRKGPGSILEKMWGWERISPFLPELMGSSSMRRKEGIKNR